MLTDSGVAPFDDLLDLFRRKPSRLAKLLFEASFDRDRALLFQLVLPVRGLFDGTEFFECKVWIRLDELVSTLHEALSIEGVSGVAFVDY